MKQGEEWGKKGRMEGMARGKKRTKVEGKVEPLGEKKGRKRRVRENKYLGNRKPPSFPWAKTLLFIDSPLLLSSLGSRLPFIYFLCLFFICWR